MRKKIALASSTLLLATLGQAEIKQNGFFVGLDYSEQNVELKYDNNANGILTSMTVLPYMNDISHGSPSFKAGYQYYFTRVYARYNSFDYKDEKRDKYTIKGTVYELNADYLPILYVSEDKLWNIRAIVGLGVGYNTSKMSDYDLGLIPPTETAGESQNYMEYGYQVGIMSETSIGLGVELGYRMRYGNLQEFTDTANNATFSLETKEFYLGVNYLF